MVNDEETNQNSEEQLRPSQFPCGFRRTSGERYIASADSTIGAVVSTSDDPTLSEAMSSCPDDHEIRKAASNAEFSSLDETVTWVGDGDPASKPLPTHVVLKVKRILNGKVERFECRIVAGGNFRVYGKNYFETHSPVVSFTFVRIFFLLALTLNMCI